MFLRALKPTARVAAIATVVGTAATVALLPTTAAFAGDVTGADPGQINNVGSHTINFTTTDTFNPAVPPRVTITGPAGAGSYGPDAGSVVVVDSHTVQASFSFPSFLPAGPGVYSVEICQSLGSQCAPSADDTSKTTILTVFAQGTMQILGVSPAVRATNADTSTPFVISGDNFAKGDTVTFVPQGGSTAATAPALTNLNVSANQISGGFVGAGASALVNAKPGIYDTVVTHTDKTTSPTSTSDQLVVVNPPTIKSVTPAATVGIGAGQNGHAARTVTLVVAGLQDRTQGVGLSFPSNASDGLSVVTQSVTTDANDPNLTDVVAAISTSPSTTAQTVNLVLTDPVSGGTVAQPLTVNQAPTISSVPNVGQGATAHSLVFTGSHLDSGATLSFPASTKVTLGTQAVDTTGQTITVPVTVDPSAPTGHTPFSVVNGDGGATDYTDANGAKPSPLTITPKPVLDSTSPPSVASGTQNQTVILNGSGFQPNMTASTDTPGVHLGTVTVSSGSSSNASVPVSVASGTAPGPVDITLTNPDGGTKASNGVLTIDAFAVNGISPTGSPNGGNGANAVPITVGGTNIPTTGTTQLQLTRLPDNGSDTTSVPPILVNPTSVTSTTWKGTANFVGAAAGNYQVRLVNNGQSGTCACTFQITSAASPTVTSVSPAALGQGADTTLLVNGTGFTQGAKVTFGKVNNADSVTPTGPAVFNSPTQLSIPVHVASNAPTGSSNKVNVTVTNPGSAPSGGTNTATCTGCLTINPGPTITSLSPATLAQGAATTLTINGTNFASGATVTFGQGISQGTGPTTVTSTQIKIPVKVDANAPSSVPVTVKNPDLGSASSSVGVNPGPKITSVKPQYVATTFTGTLIVTGSGYHQSAAVTFPNGSGVAATGNPTVSNDGTTISLPIKVTRNNAASVDVTVTNADDQGTVTCAQCLSVAVAPQDPAGVTATTNGTTATVSWTAVPTASSGGAPITGYTVSVTSPANSGIAPQTVTGTTATFTGLSASTTYSFKVVATNAANLSSPGVTVTASAPLAGTRLTLITTAGHVIAGQHFSLGGSLSSGKGDPIGGATIVVRGRNDTGQVSVVATTTTTADGGWIVFPAPRHNTTYGASYAGNSQFAPASSSRVRITVAPKVTISATHSSSAAHKLVVTGHVSPNKSGRSVHLIAVNAQGRKRNLGTTTLSGSSSYRFSVALGKGKWTLVVSIGSTSGNTGGHSNGRTVKRT